MYLRSIEAGSRDVSGSWPQGGSLELTEPKKFLTAECLLYKNTPIRGFPCTPIELELILSQMAQKPMLRGEVGARALRGKEQTWQR